nr:hypothetical protein [Sodalinema gerasimenkoae]
MLLDNGYCLGGGGGGTDESHNLNAGGLGGGGSGGNGINPPSSGLYGSGGGAGGMSGEVGVDSQNRPGAKGGDGFLLIRYPIANPPISWLN